jgi:hypothetical protein
MENTLHCLVRHARFAGMTTLALEGDQRKIGKVGRHTSTAQRAVQKGRGYTPATRVSGRVPRWLAKRPDGTRGRTLHLTFEGVAKRNTRKVQVIVGFLNGYVNIQLRIQNVRKVSTQLEKNGM